MLILSVRTFNKTGGNTVFCSNCGNKLADGVKFCSFCGTRVQAEAEQEFRFNDGMLFEEPKLDAGTAPEKDTGYRPSSSKSGVSFDWSNVVDEPHRKDTTDVRSPWASSGGIDEKELYAEMTPSTDRSRTMSFIDVLKAEKEEKEKKADERAFAYTEVLEVEPDMSSFVEPPQMHYAPLYEDVDEPVKTPFDDIDRKPERQSPEISEDPGFSTSRETIAQFDEYVKSFEANLFRDEPRFEEPVKPAKEEPKTDLPDFLRREAAPADEGPAVVSAQEKSAFELPKYEEPEYEEPVFEEPKYEETKYEDIEADEGYDALDDVPASDDGMEDMYLDMDTSKTTIGTDRVTGRSGRSEMIEEPEFPEEEEPVDEQELFEEMRRAKPEKSGMTIAPPADKLSEIEALRKRLEELTGEQEAEAAEPAAETAAAAPEETEHRSETSVDVDEYLGGLAATSAADAEVKTETPPTPPTPPTPQAPPAADEPVLLVLDDVVAEPEPAVTETPGRISIEEIRTEPVVNVAAEETIPPVEFVPEPVVPESIVPEPAAPVIFEEIRPEPAVPESIVPEPAAPIVFEEIRPEPAAQVNIAPEPAAPIVFEEIRPEPVAAVVPKAEEKKPEKPKSSDALSLEELEKDLFGENMTEEAEAEETKKIDKFYTLYRKNEEFQRLLDEEYDKLKGETSGASGASGAAAAPAAVRSPEAAPAAEQEQPAENSKAYRQIEDETIYKAFEIPPELAKAPPKEVPAAPAEAEQPGRRPVEVVPAEAAGSVALTKAERRAEAKAAKAKAKAEKKAAKAKAKEETAPEVEYEEVDTGSRFLTVLAVIIAVILVLLLAVILVLQVAPDSGLAITIDSVIEKITGGFSAVYPGDGRFLL